MDLSTKTPTHNTSSAGFQMADFSTFLSHLSEAVSAAWPGDALATRYRRVKVLLMNWDRDDLESQHQIRSLEAVFRGLYHYETEHWKIPSRRSAVELSRKVANLVDAHGQEGNLLILYYAGHARPSDQQGGSPIWAANRNRDSPTVQSSVLHSLLAEVDCDVLLLHDCCHATQTADTFTGNGLVETLAASSIDAVSTEARSHSFTSSLIQELSRAAHTANWLSVVELHRRLINRLQAWTPTVSFTDDTYSLVQIDRRTGQPIIEQPCRQTPVHSFQSKKPRTIVLAPLPPQAQQNSADSYIVLEPPTTQTAETPDGPGILVTCRLRDQHIDVERWRQWLLNTPEPARSIQISALYPGFSAVLIVELPLVVWDLLRPSPAISFIAYTTGKNHISDFRRALLGYDPDEASDSSEEESDEEDEAGTVEGRRSTRSRRKRSARNPEDTCPAPSLWPKLFDSDRTTVYALEDIPYCLNLAEMQQDGGVSKAEKIIRAFVQDTDGPSAAYVCDEIQGFCAGANFEGLARGHEIDSQPVAILDERSPGGLSSPGAGMRVLSHGQLYEALIARSLPQLIDTEAKDDLSPRRRLIYITNLDRDATLALAATASESQALPLREFVYKHLAFEAGMSVKPQSLGSQGFQLAFHLPFFAWRQDNMSYYDGRHGSDGQPLRSSQEVSFLNRPNTSSKSHIHEAQMSCMIAGVDNRHWTAYGIFDTYHDGGESKHDVLSYQSTQGGATMDPLTCGRFMSEKPVWDARDYFLRVMESCVREVTEEWQNVGRQTLKGLKGWTPDTNHRRVQRHSQQALQLLEQLTQGLARTISAWERFKEADLAYFDVDIDTTSTTIRSIDADIRDLQSLHSALTHQSSSLRSLVSNIQTHHLKTTTCTTTLLTTALSLSFLPFALATALYLLHHRPPSLSTPSTITATNSTANTDGGYGNTTLPVHALVTAAAVSCIAAACFLLVSHVDQHVDWSGVKEGISGLGRVRLRLRGGAAPGGPSRDEKLRGGMGGGAGLGSGSGAVRGIAEQAGWGSPRWGSYWEKVGWMKWRAEGDEGRREGPGKGYYKRVGDGVASEGGDEDARAGRGLPF